MTTIRYTAGGDYDASDSSDVALAAGSVAYRLNTYYSFPNGAFELSFVDGGSRSLSVNPFNDGIYADFSGSGVDASMLGGARGDVLIGGAGDDFVAGSDGNDVLTGGGGIDSLAGGTGDDRLRGGAGDDLLVGDDGRDILRGGTGADTFLFFASEGSTTEVRDLIYDFSGHGGQGDRIDLSSIGSLSFVDRFTADGSGQVRSVAGAAGVYAVLVDADGDGSTDLAIRVKSAAALTADDFVFTQRPAATAFDHAGALDPAMPHHAFAEAPHPHDGILLV